ncbi:GerAB/ArcD/ProY family transporter [Microbacteriaceae bacterium 4G12]
MVVVTNRQIFFIILCSLVTVSFIFLPGEAVRAAGTGAWFGILLLTILFIFGIFIIASLGKMFEGKTIHEYSKIIVGKFLSKIIGFIYAINFCFFSILVFTLAAELIKETSLPLTPIWALLLLFIIVTQYMVYKGITTIGRVLEIYGSIFIIIPLLVHAAEFFVGDINYIKPFFEPKLMKEYIFSTKEFLFAFVGIEILTIIPFTKINHKRGILYSIISVLYVGIYYILATETSVMIVGINQILLYKASLVEALRQAKLPNAFILQRLDSAFLIVGTIGLLSGLATILFAVTENIVKLFSIKKRNMLLVEVGMIIFVSCMFLNKYEMAGYLFKHVLPFTCIITGFIIPIILLIVAKMKKL